MNSLKIQIYKPTEVDKYRKQGVTIGKNCNLYSVSIDGCFQHLIKIGNNVWIGGNVVVLPGVTIGDNVTIGAGSVVNKDIESNSIAVGNPCKVIKKIN